MFELQKNVDKWQKIREVKRHMYAINEHVGLYFY